MTAVKKRQGMIAQTKRLVLVVIGLVFAIRADAGPEYIITDYGAIGDGVTDNAPIINSLLANLPPAGGTIVIPHGEFRIASPIVITKSFVTIRGLNTGVRSNVDAPIPGLLSTGGGSKIVLGAGVGTGLYVPNNTTRISSLTVKDLLLAGGDAGTYQTGICVDRANDALRIEAVGCINLNRGVYTRETDAAIISGNWLAECESPLHMDGGMDSVVRDNHMGGQPGGITCRLDNQYHAVITGNAIFQDGYTGLKLNNCDACLVTGNKITGWYTGLVEITGNMNNLTANTIDAVEKDGAWATDPLGRDGLWGLIRIQGNDNIMNACNVISWQPQDNTRLHIVGGDRNVLSNVNIAGIGSIRKVVLNGAGTQATRILYCGYQAEHDLGGSTSVGVLYNP